MPFGTSSDAGGAEDARGRQYLRRPFHVDFVRGEPRPGDRVRGGRMPARPRARRIRHPTRSRTAPSRPKPAHHPTPGIRSGSDPLRGIRGRHHRHPDRTPHRERRCEDPRLFEDPGRVPPGACRLHLSRQIRSSRPSGRRPGFRPRDRGAGRGRCDRQEVSARAFRLHGARLARPARPVPAGAHRPRRSGPQPLLLSRSRSRARAGTLHGRPPQGRRLHRRTGDGPGRGSAARTRRAGVREAGRPISPPPSWGSMR